MPSSAKPSSALEDVSLADYGSTNFKNDSKNSTISKDSKSSKDGKKKKDSSSTNPAKSSVPTWVFIYASSMVFLNGTCFVLFSFIACAEEAAKILKYSDYKDYEAGLVGLFNVVIIFMQLFCPIVGRTSDNLFKDDSVLVVKMDGSDAVKESDEKDSKDEKKKKDKKSLRNNATNSTDAKWYQVEHKSWQYNFLTSNGKDKRRPFIFVGFVLGAIGCVLQYIISYSVFEINEEKRLDFEETGEEIEKTKLAILIPTIFCYALSLFLTSAASCFNIAGSLNGVIPDVVRSEADKVANGQITSIVSFSGILFGTILAAFSALNQWEIFFVYYIFFPANFIVYLMSVRAGDWAVKHRGIFKKESADKNDLLVDLVDNGGGFEEDEEDLLVEESDGEELLVEESDNEDNKSKLQKDGQHNTENALYSINVIDSEANNSLSKSTTISRSAMRLRSDSSWILPKRNGSDSFVSRDSLEAVYTMRSDTMKSDNSTTSRDDKNNSLSHVFFEGGHRRENTNPEFSSQMISTDPVLVDKSPNGSSANSSSNIQVMTGNKKAQLLKKLDRKAKRDYKITLENKLLPTCGFTFGAAVYSYVRWQAVSFGKVLSVEMMLIDAVFAPICLVLGIGFGLWLDSVFRKNKSRKNKSTNISAKSTMPAAEITTNCHDAISKSKKFEQNKFLEGVNHKAEELVPSTPPSKSKLTRKQTIEQLTQDSKSFMYKYIYPVAFEEAPIYWMFWHEVLWNVAISSDEYLTFFIRDLYGLQQEKVRRLLMGSTVSVSAIMGLIAAALVGGFVKKGVKSKKWIIYLMAFVGVFEEAVLILCPVIYSWEDPVFPLALGAGFQGLSNGVHFVAGTALIYDCFNPNSKAGKAEILGIWMVASVLGLCVGAAAAAFCLQLFSIEAVFGGIDTKITSLFEVDINYANGIKEISPETLDKWKSWNMKYDHLVGLRDVDGDPLVDESELKRGISSTHYTFFAYFMMMFVASLGYLSSAWAVSKVKVAKTQESGDK